MFVCLCKGLTVSDVQRVAPTAGPTPGDLIEALGLDSPQCCGRCARNIDEIMLLAAASRPSIIPLPVVNLARGTALLQPAYN